MRILRLSLLLLAVPVVELLFLRLFLKYALQLKIGSSYFTDFDFLVPVPIATALFVSSLPHDSLATPRLLPRSILQNSIALAVFLILNLVLYLAPEIRSSSLSGVYWLAWWAGLLSVLFTAVTLWVPASIYLGKSSWPKLAAAAIVGFSIPLILNTPHAVWELYGSYTSQWVHWVFQTFWSGSVSVSFDPQGYLFLSQKPFRVGVGQGCSGMEGGILFTVAFFQFRNLTGLSWSKMFGAAIFALGLTAMFLTNIVRIVCLFWIGVGLREVAGPQRGTQLFKFVAHTHMGWVFYLSVLFGFFSLVTYFLMQKHGKSSRSKGEAIPLTHFVDEITSATPRHDMGPLSPEQSRL